MQRKRVLITGGASGIGLATARRLQANGAHLTLMDINEAALATAADDLSVPSILADCTDYDQIQASLSPYENQPPDVVIHCAGILHTGLFEAISPERHRQTVAVNLTGTLNIAQATLPLLRRTKGSLILVASVSAFYGPPEFASYAATKAAVLSFAQSMRVELADSGVHIGVVSPNLVDTPMLSEENVRNASLTKARSPLLKRYTPEEIAQTIERGIVRRQFMIFPDWRTRLAYILSRYGAWASHHAMRITWRQSQR